jgi:hypothetical protein
MLSAYYCGESEGTSAHCSAASVTGPPTTCCNWGGDEQCKCAAYACSTSGSSCVCAWGPPYQVDSGIPSGATALAPSCTEMFCCVDSPSLIEGLHVDDIEGPCTFSDLACTDSQIQVDHCGTDNPATACTGAGTQVPSCQ